MGSMGKGDWKKVPRFSFCAGVTKLQALARSKMEVLGTV